MPEELATSQQRPEGVSETEWDALGDPGKAALTRERQARAEAEARLAEATAPKPTPPKQPQEPARASEAKGGEQPDIEALIAQAVEKAVAPYQQAQESWQAEQAAMRIQEAVTTAAVSRFHDASDALANVDLSELTDGQGGPDGDKIAAALDSLAQKKPHLVKSAYSPRTPAPGQPFGAPGGTAVPLDDRVKSTLSRMQQAVRGGSATA